MKYVIKRWKFNTTGRSIYVLMTVKLVIHSYNSSIAIKFIVGLLKKKYVYVIIFWKNDISKVTKIDRSNVFS